MLNKHASNYVKTAGLEKEAWAGTAAYIGTMFLPKLLRATRNLRRPIMNAIKGTKFGKSMFSKISPTYFKSQYIAGQNAGASSFLKIPSQWGAAFNNSKFGQSKFIQGIKQGLARSNKEYYRDSLRSAKHAFGDMDSKALESLVEKRVARLAKARGILPEDPRYAKLFEQTRERIFNNYNKLKMRGGSPGVAGSTGKNWKKEVWKKYGNPGATGVETPKARRVFNKTLTETENLDPSWSAKFGRWIGYNAKPWQYKPTTKALELGGIMATPYLIGGSANDDNSDYDTHQEALDYYRRTYGTDPRYR